MSARTAWKADLLCHEEVSRDDYVQPCEKHAIGYRVDPNSAEPYPVCAEHHRPPLWLTALDELRQAKNHHPGCQVDPDAEIPGGSESER